MYQTNSSGPQINGGPGPDPRAQMLAQPILGVSHPGGLGSLVQKGNRQVNAGPSMPQPMQQPMQRPGFRSHGGGLARLAEMYGMRHGMHSPGAMYK